MGHVRTLCDWRGEPAAVFHTWFCAEATGQRSGVCVCGGAAYGKEWLLRTQPPPSPVPQTVPAPQVGGTATVPVLPGEMHVAEMAPEPTQGFWVTRRGPGWLLPPHGCVSCARVPAACGAGDGVRATLSLVPSSFAASFGLCLLSPGLHQVPPCRHVPCSLTPHACELAARSQLAQAPQSPPPSSCARPGPGVQGEGVGFLICCSP